MPTKSSRRNFLASAAGFSAASGLCAHNALPLAAIEPIERNGQPKFSFSLAAYSYRDLLNNAKSKFTLADFIDDCAKFGLDGTELTSYYFPKEVSEAYLHMLKRRCFRAGLEVSGTAVGNDFGHPEGEKRREQIEHVKRWVDHAEMLGAPVIRVFAGHSKKGVAADASHKLMTAGLEECCAYAGEHGVHLALENHGGPTSTVAGLLQFVRDVRSPWFGVNLDTGNFRSDTVYADLEKAAPYALNVQVKVTLKRPGGAVEAMDYARLAKILRGSGYRGYIVLEYEEKGDPRAECPKHLDQLREAFA